MDAGIVGRSALICASSQGLGLACAIALAREGAHVVLNGRIEEKLARASEELCRAVPNAAVSHVVADINSESGRAALIAASPQADILINNNAGPPPGTIEDWDHDAWIKSLEANLIAPILLIRALLPGMRSRRFGRIVNVTSAMVKSPRYAMTLSTAARAGLTAACKAISREVAADNVTINNLLPERIDTPRQEFMAARMMKEQAIDRDTARKQIASSIAARRFGTPEEFANACVFLCSDLSGFISGQNLQLDGGSYAGLV